MEFISEIMRLTFIYGGFGIERVGILELSSRIRRLRRYHPPAVKPAALGSRRRCGIPAAAGVAYEGAGNASLVRIVNVSPCHNEVAEMSPPRESSEGEICAAAIAMSSAHAHSWAASALQCNGKITSAGANR